MLATSVNRIAFITGASSGIGLAIAEVLATRGWSLGLIARRADALDALAKRLRTEHPQARFAVATADVADVQAQAAAFTELQRTLGAPTMVIANAGMVEVNRTGTGHFATDEKIIRVNLLGGMATVDLAAEVMRASGGGTIVGISSISAFRSIPGSAAYSASKAGFSNYLDAVRMELANKGIRVLCVHPGFVKTDLSPNMEKYPFVIPADVAANAIVRGIEKGQRDIVVPTWPWRWLRPLMPLLPDAIVKSLF